MHAIRENGYRISTGAEPARAEAEEVIVAAEPPLLRGMLSRVIGGVRGLRVRAELADLAGLEAVLEKTTANWVIVTLGPDGEMPEIVRPVLEKHPSISVLGVAPDGSGAKMQRAGGTVTIMAELSLDQLIRIMMRPRSSRLNASWS